MSNPVTICDVGPEEMLDLPQAAESPEYQVTLDLFGPEQGPFEPMPPCMEFYKVERFSIMIRFLPILNSSLEIKTCPLQFHSDHLCSTTAHNGSWPLPLPNSVFLPPMFCPVPAAINLGAQLVKGKSEQRPAMWSWWRVDGKLQVYEVKAVPLGLVERLSKRQGLTLPGKAL